MIKQLDKMNKIKLRLNNKTPINKWSDNKNHFKSIDATKFNVGLPCGTVNNIFVLDIDNKDNGMEEFNKYITQHGEPDTLTVKTPSGGTHYYFNLKTDNSDLNYIIKQVCYTRSKLGGFGIDIRSNKGYVVAPPSSINGISYEIVKDKHISDISLTLADYLLELSLYNSLKHSVLSKPIGTKTQFEMGEHLHTHYHYDVTDTNIMQLLNLLGNDYLDNFELWFKITTILKGLNKKELWKKWSKTSSRYNSLNNKDYWQLARPIIDINYIVHILRNNGLTIEYIQKYKIYEPLTVDNFYGKKIDDNKQYVSDMLHYQDFEEFETIIIKSCTGTGKTTVIATHIEEYLKQHPKHNFLTLTTRTTLSDQHMKSFKNINLQHYQQVKDINEIERLTLCLNSLHKLTLDMRELEDYIIYIDEIASFLEFTHNDTLDNNIQTVYGMLMDIMKHAKKVIVSDALINDNVISFLKHRETDQTLYINNLHQKYSGVKAIRIRDESKLLQQLLLNCCSNDYFLFGCDSCDTVTKLYHYCLSKAREEDKNKYILITADTDYKIHDANSQFKHRFVFYSPKITFGIDFSYDLPQDVFIYVKGRTINPFGIFQQTTRTRNIKQLYFYCETFSKEANYQSMNELKEHLENTISKSHILNSICSCYNENDERTLIENTFLKLYVYNEYTNDTLNTDKYKHFRDILSSNGFNIEEMYEPTRINKDTREEMTEMITDISNELWIEYLACDTKGKKDTKYDNIQTNLELLGLIGQDNDRLNEYRTIITNKYLLTEHFNIMKLFRNDTYIKEKLEMKHDRSLKTKLLKCQEHKILLLRRVEAYHNMEPLSVSSVGLNNNADFKQLDNDTFNSIKYAYETKKTNPTDHKELQELYVFMVKQLSSKELIKSERSKSKETRDKTIYKLNEEFINYHIKLSSYKTKYYNKYQPWFIEKYSLNTKQATETEENDNVPWLDM